MAYILHIDTSADNCTTILSHDGQVVQYFDTPGMRNHAAVINTQVDTLLQNAGIGLGHLSAVDVCGGPGSYTGLRIGLATAKGYCYALDKPLMMQSRLLLLAAEARMQNSNQELIISVLQAREGEYFYALYNRSLETVVEPQHIFEDGLKETVMSLGNNIMITGEETSFIMATAAEKKVLFKQQVYPGKESWVSYTFQQYNCNGFVSLANATPFYLKQVFTHNKQ